MTKEKYGDYFKKYLDDLAAKLPAPGGGSAAALVGAIGAALVSMVCNFTVGKKKYKEVEKDVEEILSKSESIRKKLQGLIDKDVEAYQNFANSDKDEKACKEALSVPLEICKLSHQALMLCPELAKKGNALLISDVYCAEELLKGALHSAVFNVEINLSGIKNKDYIEEIKRITGPLMREETGAR